VTLIEDFRSEAQALLAASDASAELGEVLAAIEEAISTVEGLAGVSVTIVHEGQPYTLTAISTQMRLLDAAQYAGGGPCVEASTSGDVVHVDDMFNDKRWRLFARAAAGNGVGSSLSLPLSPTGATIGAVNLYGGSAHVFSDDTVHRLSALLSGATIGSTDGPDLSFLADEAVEERFDPMVARAVGVLMEIFGSTPEQARRRLQRAAAAAQISPGVLARAICSLPPP
jgi:hypothetical protein